MRTEDQICKDLLIMYLDLAKITLPEHLYEEYRKVFLRNLNERTSTTNQ